MFSIYANTSRASRAIFHTFVVTFLLNIILCICDTFNFRVQNITNDYENFDTNLVEIGHTNCPYVVLTNVRETLLSNGTLMKHT